jgi:glycosyltransferase involved in cell wall biosynthesis
MNARPPLLIVLPNLPSTSETFLRSHIEQLPARVSVVHGGTPQLDEGPLLSMSWPARAWRKANRLLQRRGYDAEATAAYAEALRRVRPVAVLAEYGGTAAAVRAACVAASVPLIAHFHGYDASQTELLRRLAEPYRLLFRDAAAIIAVSRAMKDSLIGLGAPSARVHWNPYGVDLSKFGGGDPQAAAPVFLAVGRFTPKKAPQRTLRAFALVHRQYPEARLRMIGCGELLEACRTEARDQGLANVVTFLGECSPERVRNEMRQARCFVQHSVVAPNGDSEGTPVSILEAGASGLPVVSTRHAGIPDVVVEGETGLLTDEGDIDGMAANMLRLARDGALAADLGRAARRRIAAEFSQSLSLFRLWEIIAGTKKEV